MGAFGLNGFGNVDTKVEAKLRAAKAVSDQIFYGQEGRKRAEYLQDAMRQAGEMERLYGEAIGLYEAAGMMDKAAALRLRAERHIGDIVQIVFIAATDREPTQSGRGSAMAYQSNRLRPRAAKVRGRAR